MGIIWFSLNFFEVVNARVMKVTVDFDDLEFFQGLIFIMFQ